MVAQVHRRPGVGQRGRNAVGPSRVRDHDRASSRHEHVEGRDVERLLVRVGLEHREGLVGVETGAAEAREVLEASADPLRVEAVEEVPGRLDDPRRVRRGARSPSTSPPAPGIDRSTTGARSTSKPSRDSARPASSPARRAAPGARRLLQRGGRREQVAQAVDGAALLVQEQEARAEVPNVGDQALELRLALDVAPEEDDAERRMRGEDLALARGERRALDADAEEARAHERFEPVLKRREQRQCGDRSHLIDVERAQLLEGELLLGREEEELAAAGALAVLAARGRARPARRAPASRDWPAPRARGP